MATQYTRKNAAHLTTFERGVFLSAIQKLKANGTWDRLVGIHWEATTRVVPVGSNPINGAHRGPAFLPWHRQFLILMETELRKVSSTALTLPYWDWTTDPQGTQLFLPDFMGGNGSNPPNYAVTNGPFAQWQTVAFSSPGAPFPTGPLRRAFGVNAKMPTQTMIHDVMFGSSNYDNMPWNSQAQDSFRNDIETMLHDRVHVWVGGHMLNPTISPNDPIFYLHHANIDRLWYRWQEVHPSATYNAPNNLPQGQKPNDIMIALNVTPLDVWKLEDLPYRYDRSPGLRGLAGASEAAFSNFQTDRPATISVRTTPPPQASTLKLGLTQSYLSFFGADHHLRVDEFRLTTPPADTSPKTVEFQVAFNDDSNKRPHAIDGAAVELYQTAELSQ